MTGARSILDALGVKAPDIRAWAAFGFFALTWKALDMISQNPSLLKDAAYMTFVGALTSGGVLCVANNLFGGTKSGADVSNALARFGPGTGAGAVDGATVVSTTNSTVATTTSTTTDPSASPAVAVPDGGAAIVVAPNVTADIKKD